jgi:UDP-N-acetyl-D-glucosamine dehydrogenase
MSSRPPSPATWWTPIPIPSPRDVAGGRTDAVTQDSAPAQRVVVVGQGYVGLALAMRAVEVGFDVVGFDQDEDRVKRLSTADSFIEDVSDAMLGAALASGRYEPTLDPERCARFDVAVIDVPTPLTEGNPNLTHVEEAARILARHLRPGATVILESTTYPGTTEELVAPILEEGSGLTAGPDFHLGYSPERIDPGNPTWNLVTIPKVVSGIDEPSLEAVRGFFDRIVDRTVPVRDTRVAEMTKLLENTFRHVNVALVNELAMFAGDLGIDIWESIDAASSKPFGFMRFTPGPGVGGHCLPIDPSYLSWTVRRRLGRSFRFVELANDVNDHMPDYVVRRLVHALNRMGKPVRGSRVLLLGLAYKRNTADVRTAPGMVIAESLAELGAEIRVADPHMRAERVSYMLVDANASELADADAVVLVTDHDAFDYELVRQQARYVLDTRNRIAGPNVEPL